MRIKFSIYLIILFLFYNSFGQYTNSLYSDVKGHDVGDILSVIIVETADASRETRSNNSSTSDMGLDASLSGDVTKKIPKFGLSSSWSDSYNGEEGTEQKERLTGRIAVKISEKMESGNFKIEGERAVEVNGEENVMILTGYVRPRDILSNNTVFSYHIADAKITYKKGGFLNGVVKQGTFPKILTWIAGIAVVIVGAGVLIL